jgi:Uma2 family endonuclease
MVFDPTGATAELPDLDDRLVEPGTPYEMLDGELVYVPPADAPHGERQVQLSALIAAHTGPEFKVAADLLTRTSKRDDFAPDVSVYLAAPDPVTGRRQLAQLAFEILATQTVSHAATKAAKLAARGVRRVFAIDIERSRLLEWSVVLGGWSLLYSSGELADPALRVPLPIELLIHSASIDDAVARALIAKNNAVFADNRAEGEAEGRARGEAEGMAKGKLEGRAAARAESVVELLVRRGVALDAEARARILAEHDPVRLDRWFARAVVCASVAELFAEQ